MEQHIWEINNCILAANNHRSTGILNKVYKAFFYCDDFQHWAHRPNQKLLATCMLALEIKFERSLYFYNEGYETGDDYDVVQLVKNLPTWMQYHQWLQLPSNPWITRNQWYPSLCQPKNEDL